jgi:hypothetical protein
MQQSVFSRRVRLVVIEEPFVEISQQCHEAYGVEHAKTQANKRKRTRVTVEAEPGTRHKNQRCRGKGQHDLRVGFGALFCFALAYIVLAGVSQMPSSTQFLFLGTLLHSPLISSCPSDPFRPTLSSPSAISTRESVVAPVNERR